LGQNAGVEDDIEAKLPESGDGNNVVGRAGRPLNSWVHYEKDVALARGI